MASLVLNWLAQGLDVDLQPVEAKISRRDPSEVQDVFILRGRGKGGYG